MCTLLDTMSTETGEMNAQAAHRTALETVIEDTEAELAKLQRSKVASMIRLYQGEIYAPPLPAGTSFLSHQCHSSEMSATLWRKVQHWAGQLPQACASRTIPSGA